MLGDHAGNPKGLVGRYELETPAGVVTFFSLHLESPRHALVGVAHDSETGPANLQANSDLRRSQSVWVAGEAVGVRGPVVLAGDFNTPPESDLFHTVWASYTDAFSAAGWGWGHTFIGGRTAVRIDHVLMGRGWRCRRCRVGPWIGSPHRPVIADLVWVGESGSALRQIRE